MELFSRAARHSGGSDFVPQPPAMPSSHALSAFFTLLLPLLAEAQWQTTNIPTSDVQTKAPAVWFRCFIRVPDNMATPAEKDLWRDSIMLNLGGIHEPFSVLINGEKIAESGAIPDGERRRFKVP